MRRASLLTTALLLALTASAQAKMGVEFDKFTEQVKPGEKVDFTVMTYHSPTAEGDGYPIRGRRPLITFHSESGATIRVRASKTDLNGIAYGSVVFPDKGPWTTGMKVGRDLEMGPEFGGSFDVGTGLTETIPSADAQAKAAHPTAGKKSASAGDATSPASADAGAPWLWIASLAAIGAAALAFAMRRRGHWGAA